MMKNVLSNLFIMLLKNLLRKGCTPHLLTPVLPIFASFIIVLLLQEPMRDAYLHGAPEYICHNARKLVPFRKGGGGVMPSFLLPTSSDI